MNKLPGILLSSYEASIVSDCNFIYTKRKIIDKVCQIFSQVSISNETQFNVAFPEIKSNGPRISKGENYRRLPYVILDFPGLFSKESVFAIRCFFWWGNFFSITLHMSGTYLYKFASPLMNATEEGLLREWSISCSDDEWQHHFEADNYEIINAEHASTFAGRRFIKIAKKIPLTKWNDVHDFYTANFNKLLEVLTYQAPMR